MKCIILLFSLAILLTASSSVMATAMCTPSDVKLGFIQLAFDPSSPDPDPLPITLPGAIDASDCLILLGNDKPYPRKKTGGNIGVYKDGLLNGAVWKKATDPLLTSVNTLFDPFVNDGADADIYNDTLKFITPVDLQDLDDDGDFNDPGWVFLGKDDGDLKEDGVNDGIGDGFQYAHTGIGIVDDIGAAPGTLDGIDIGKLIDVDFTCLDGGDSFALGDGNIDCTKGTWSIIPDYDIAIQLEELFGEGVFDHLAFVFKTGKVCLEYKPINPNKPNKPAKCKTKGPVFTIYDFNFNDIFAGNLESLQSPHNLGGTFDLGSTFDGKGISHISVWARDPAFFAGIPEPKSTMLMLIALGLLVLRLKSKRAP